MMQVCNICLGVPEYTGRPEVKQINRSNVAEVYVFGPDWTRAVVDLCKTCLDDFQNGRWDKLAERARDVLMLRLGVPNDVAT